MKTGLIMGHVVSSSLRFAAATCNIGVAIDRWDISPFARAYLALGFFWLSVWGFGLVNALHDVQKDES